MMETYAQWARRYPDAAAALERMHAAAPWLTLKHVSQPGNSEAWAQQQTRLCVAQQGAHAWRNNVGATPNRCPDCGYTRQPVRYGLANDSAALNRKIKSSDLILAIPRVITSEMVGETIAQFGAVECKRPGWQYTGKQDEPAQMAWLTLITQIGGYAAWSTGRVDL